jgi:hypothetical protein
MKTRRLDGQEGKRQATRGVQLLREAGGRASGGGRAGRQAEKGDSAAAAAAAVDGSLELTQGWRE